MGHKPFVQEKGASHRPARFAARIREELIDLIPGSLRDPRMEGVTMLTIVSVEVTPDLKHGAVMFSLMDAFRGNEKRIKEIEAALNQASGFLRRELMHRLHTKITPQLLFRYDHGFDKSAEIDPLFKQIQATKPRDDSEE